MEDKGFLNPGYVIVSTIAQTTLTGVIIDSNRQSALPFLNIGIKDKNIGTSSALWVHMSSFARVRF